MTPQLFAIDGGADDDGEHELFEDLPADPASESQARSTLHGKEFDAEALELLESLGATVVEEYPKVDGYPLDFLLEGPNGRRLLVDARGTPDRTDRGKAGLRRQDTVLKFGFKAMRLAARGCPYPLVLVTSHLPRPGSSSAFLLSELNDSLLDVVATVGDLAGRRRLGHYLTAELPAGPIAPLPAPWREAQLDLDFTVGADEADGGTDDDEEEGTDA